jgi:hypothetical protein
MLISVATGALSAHAGRDEIRHSADPLWRMEGFLAYALFVALVLVPTAIYFYVFHGDWFLFYCVETRRAPWFWGFVAVSLLLGSASLGFLLGAALCRASRDRLVRRLSVGVIVLALASWPSIWRRLSVVGSYRQFARDYGLTAFFSSPAFYSGLLTGLLLLTAFVWLVFRIDRQTRDRS